jgi:hypothetical protein
MTVAELMQRVPYEAYMAGNGAFRQTCSSFIDSACTTVTDCLRQDAEGQQHYQLLQTAYTRVVARKRFQGHRTTIFQEDSTYFKPQVVTLSSISTTVLERCQPSPSMITVRWGRGITTTLNLLRGCALTDVFTILFNLMADSVSPTASYFYNRLLGLVSSILHCPRFYTCEDKFFEVAQTVFPNELKDAQPIYLVLDTCHRLLQIGQRLNSS